MAIRYCDWATGNDWSGAGGADNGGYTGALSAYAAGTTYALGNRVYYGTAPTRYVWRSLQNSNTGHTPAEGAWWTLVADGSAAKPCRSITDADDGLTGGDEVRVGKSPANTPCGNLDWTDNSTTVARSAGNSTDLTTIFAAKDFVCKATVTVPGNQGTDEGPWEIASVTASSITLSYAYAGTTASGVASAKLGVTDTGAAAAASTAVQTYGTSGVSDDSRLTVSGGWDLAAEAASPSAAGTRGNATGQTWFWQSGTNRYGYGLTSGGSSIAWVTISDIGILRYSSCIRYQGYGTAGHRYLRCSVASGSYGLEFNTGAVVQIDSLWVSAHATYGIALTQGGGGAGGYLRSARFVKPNPGGNSALIILGGSGFEISSCTFTRAVGSNMFVGCSDMALDGITGVNAPANALISANWCHRITARNLTMGGYSAVMTCSYPGALAVGERGPMVFAPAYSGADWIMGYGGNAYVDTTGGPGGLACLRYAPGAVSATVQVHTGDLFQFWAPAGRDFTATVALKQSGTYTSGDVKIGVYDANVLPNDAAVVADATQTVTTSWATYTITVPAASLTAGRLLLLRVTMLRQSGSDLNVYIGSVNGVPLTRWHDARPILPTFPYGAASQPNIGVM